MGARKADVHARVSAATFLTHRKQLAHVAYDLGDGELFDHLVEEIALMLRETYGTSDPTGLGMLVNRVLGGRYARVRYVCKDEIESILERTER